MLYKDKYEQDYSSITHPNHSAIYIKHELFGVNWFYKPRRCYDNNNRAANDGLVMKFNDNVFNTNVTVTPKDSISINDPSLIQNLLPGLYKIEKNYDDGSTNETVLIKNNQ